MIKDGEIKIMIGKSLEYIVQNELTSKILLMRTKFKNTITNNFNNEIIIKDFKR
jgi:hypothetical protein